MKPHFRMASVDDLQDIVEIYNQTIPSRQVTSDLEPVSVESRLPWFHAHDPDKHPIWVVDRAVQTSSQGRLAAWLSFSKFHYRAAYDGTAELSLYVDQACRRQGWGQYLLEEAIKEAPLLGLHSLVGLIFAHNPASLNLFAKAGFQTWAHLPRVAQMDGRRYDLIMMGKNLS